MRTISTWEPGSSIFFDAATPWHRSLWNPSLVLILKEILEASEAFRASARGKDSLKDLLNHAVKIAGTDPGTGELRQRRLLQQALAGTVPHDGFDFLTVSGITRDIESHYLARWSTVVADDPNTRPRPERTARAVAAYLLDLGFSSNFLHRWWTYRVRHEPGTREMADLLQDAHQLAQGTLRTFKVLIAFETAPKDPAGLPPRWIDARTVSDWLKKHNFGTHGIRQEGGMLFQLPARDADSAVDAATELLDNFAARLEISTNLAWRGPLPMAWVANEPRPLKLARRTRKVHVRALEREAQIYSASAPSIVDAALELLAPLQSSSPSAAVAGGWAAIEALLGESTDHSLAAERLASLVACSFPRAELTFLSYLVEQLPGQLATALAASATNRDRCAVLTNAIENGTPLFLTKPSDVAAVDRMRNVLSEPYATLHNIQGHATSALLRLYRQRNLVLHWGKTDAVALRASLRTAAPLVGAGMDRIAHAWFVERIRPLELAARARVALAVVGTRPGTNCLDLLG